MYDADSDKPVVIVADDDPTMRRVFSRALVATGYQVLLAMNVEEAMEYLRYPNVRAVVLDMLFVNSGGKSGLDVLEFIRSEQSLGDLPVIVVTGFPLNRSVTQRVEGLRAEIWSKPFELAKLTERVGELVLRQS